TSHVSAMTHHVFEVDGTESKKELVQKLASGTGRRILFMRTKHQAKKLAKSLTDSGIPSVDLHGNLSQVARDRNLAAFSAGDVKVLVATDVAARGVHVDDIELVIHVDPPAEHKAYLHRSGRTARAGSAGDVVTVVLPEQKRDTDALLKKAAIKVTPQRVNANSPAVAALVGDVAAYVKPAPRVEQPQGQSQGGRSQGANAQRKRVNRDDRDNGRGGQGAGGRGGRSERSGDVAPAGARHDRTDRPAASGRSHAPQGNGGGRSAQGSGSGRSGGLQVGGLVRGASSAGGARRSAPRRAQG
ncbi:MAG TPA: helicase-related protein, partial [Cryobacterium sp.]|nr:helicase-related protein [Cryobacterium sp.]